MFTLNRLSLIGRIPEHPHIFIKGNNERVATLCLHTYLDEDTQRHLRQYNVFIDNPKIIEYVDTFLSAGDMIYVEGQLEPVPVQDSAHPDHVQENWISISADQGLLLLLHTSSQILQKKSSMAC